MYRRTVVKAATAIPALAMLATLGACVNGAPKPTPAEVATDVQAIASGLDGALANLPPGLVPADKIAKAAAALADLAIVAKTIGAAETTSAAQPMMQRVEADVNAVVAALAGLPIPPPASTAIQAALVLLPVVEMAVNMVVPAAATAHPAMTPAQARAVLLSTAKR